MSHPVCIQATAPRRRRGQTAFTPLAQRWRASLLWIASLIILCLATISCAPGRTPELLDIYEVSPGTIEHNARLELSGTGFPDRRRARLVFQGTLYRPGETPRSIVAPFTVTADSTSLVSLTVTHDVLQTILGGAAHGTFRGRITVTFDRLQKSAPSLNGSKDDVVLDWFGDAATRRSVEQELQREAERFLEFVGVRADESLTVIEVVPGGEAERTGLQLGDQLVALDGVRLDTLADFVPRKDGWQSLVTVRRGSGEVTLSPWDRTGFRPAQLTDVPRAAVWVFAATILLFVSMGRRARWWALVEDRLALQKGEGRRGRFAWLQRLLAACNPAGLARQMAPQLWLAPYALFFFVFALWASVALGRGPAWLDLPTVLLSALASISMAALLLGGQSTVSGWRLTRGLRAAAAILVSWVPVIVAACGVVFEVGSLHLADVVASQGPLPQQWRVSSSPWALAAFALLVAACVPEAGPRRSPWSKRERHDLGTSLGRLLEWFAVALTCGLAAALFLGGWQVEQAGQRLVSPLVGAGLFLAKTWLLLHVVLWWRGVLGNVRSSEVFGAWVCRGVPLAMGCAVLQLVSTANEWALRHAQDLRLATWTIAFLVGGFFVFRAVRALGRPAHYVAINPWL